MKKGSRAGLPSCCSGRCEPPARLFFLAFGLLGGQLGLTGTARARTNAKRAGWLVAIVIAGGFSLVPTFVLFNVIK